MKLFVALSLSLTVHVISIPSDHLVMIYVAQEGGVHQWLNYFYISYKVEFCFVNIEINNASA